ncbi:iron-containing alcohol dehydrogenase [Paenibacillus sacheonensis]|uniref:Iron-containing alcohol dehydrogenase n=1 Tax=Paenibacillus sacheonensis TaxID=742054 RepID=A0A7X4YT57_9BACL|nr:iron-containing alcohol dehydrogenase [Paenibacillus sacheonensis]MBM7563583.1 alcohol dehydrogenase YqhD (iron-dependent ADH family) [Paenibacillus sacheonensis]NBC71121.1 iron-containing alcohol dehydrogenase [Paenibacillus sacheonensis]
MKSFTYQNPTKIVFGQGTTAQLGELVEPYGKTVLLVYGSGSIKRTGLYDQVMSQLHSIDAKVVELSGIEPNPRLTSVKRGIELCRGEGVDFILAVGGGSVLDAAKAIAAGVPYDGDVWDFFMHKAAIADALPMGAILTLSATGSEMNGNAVVSNWETKQKRSFGSIHTYPRFSILDPTLTFSVPRDQTVNGIVDIMSHVFEQYFSLTEDVPLQERLCESILQTVIENAELALDKPDSYEARANLMLCGTLALNGGLISVGMANDWASHGIEHEISAIYDIPHGAGLSIVFPNWMKYVYAERVGRFAQYAERVWGIERGSKSDEDMALAGISATRAFFTRIGAPATLSFYDIGEEHLDVMAREAVLFGPIGNFKKLHEQDVKEILVMAL